jgi:hypothetical protein
MVNEDAALLNRRVTHMTPAALFNRRLQKYIATRFPDELGSRVPPKRKAWTSQNARMDIFDAVGLVVAFRLKNDDALRNAF